MNKDFNITKKEMLDALKRSGYLLESEISMILVKADFFVESNQIIEDPITGKSREIDLLAEYYRYEKERAGLKTCSKIKFVFEIKNNLFPIVLLNRFEFSPNIEDWTGLKELFTVPKNLTYSGSEGFYEEIILDRVRYTQYCSFHKKKVNEELMALHPDIIHKGLSKITQYCEEMVKLYDECEEDTYFRHFLYLPILLINDELYELNDAKINKVESSILVYNYYFNKEPKMAYIFVITKKGFPNFIDTMLKVEDNVEQKMIELRKSLA